MRLGIIRAPIWEVQFLDVSFTKRCLLRHFITHLKAHNKQQVGIKVSAQGGGVMTATNMCSNFGGKWCSPPLIHARLRNVLI